MSSLSPWPVSTLSTPPRPRPCSTNTAWELNTTENSPVGGDGEWAGVGLSVHTENRVQKQLMLMKGTRMNYEYMLADYTSLRVKMLARSQWSVWRQHCRVPHITTEVQTWDIFCLHIHFMWFSSAVPINLCPYKILKGEVCSPKGLSLWLSMIIEIHVYFFSEWVYCTVVKLSFFLWCFTYTQPNG